MTLEEFIEQTADMPPSTNLLVLDDYGDFSPLALITIEDLEDGDPARESFPPTAIVLAPSAE